jgi:hypothetical protein
MRAHVHALERVRTVAARLAGTAGGTGLRRMGRLFDDHPPAVLQHSGQRAGVTSGRPPSPLLS